MFISGNWSVETEYIERELGIKGSVWDWYRDYTMTYDDVCSFRVHGDSEQI
jgi:hypothetical protein